MHLGGRKRFDCGSIGVSQMLIPRRLRKCICICMYIYIYIYMYNVYAYRYVCMYIYIYIYTHSGRLKGEGLMEQSGAEVDLKLPT